MTSHAQGLAVRGTLSARLCQIAALILLSAMPVVAAPAAARGAGEGVDLARLKAIRLPAEPPAPLAQAAKVVQTALKQRYALDVPIAKGGARADESAILIGRAPAAAAGMIGAAELGKVKFDGFVIKASAGRIAVAAWRPRGTLYAAYVLLDRLGLKRYSGGRELPFGEVFRPLPGKRVPPFALADRPFFEYRSVIGHVGRGVCGESYGDLGNPREAANQDLFGRAAQKKWLPREWLGADHTAAYLVPKQLYYAEHPEYFAMHRGKRLPASTLMQRMNLCLSHPAVTSIARRRMVEWMGIQPDRRFFYCTDADSGPCRCPKCTAMDYVDYYDTDRYLTWVNAVARAAAAKYPDNRLFAIAYISMVKPPVATAPEPNVIVLYCPWFWTSVGCRTATFAHPKNLTAMEEISAWLRRFPDQVGIYDYPGHGAYQWIRGMTKRIKWYAKRGVRTVYCCGTPLLFDGVFHHVITRQLWDPLADTGELTDEYVRAMYGQAAGPVRQLLRRNDTIWERELGNPVRTPELVAEFEALFRRAEQLARTDKPIVRQRVWKNVLIYLRAVLPASDPRKVPPASAEQIERFRRRVLWYVATVQADAAEHKRNRNTYMLRNRQAELGKTLKSLGIDADALLAPAALGGKEGLLDRAVAHPAAITAGIAVTARPAEPPDEAVAVVSFRTPDGAAGWRASCPVEGVAARAAPASVKPPLPALGEPAKGVSIALPFSKLPLRKLPIRPTGRNELHAGWFALRKTLAQPVDATGCDAVELTLHASCDMPVSVTVATEGAGEVRSDVMAHAGRSVLRMDLDGHAASRWPREKWTGRITAVQLVFWPPDNVYPHPPVRDASAALLGVVARRGQAAPADLPFAGKAVHLAQIRSNIPHRIPDVLRFPPRRGAFDEPSGQRERFRTWTARRVVTPLVAVLTAPKPTAGQRDAATQTQTYLRKLTGVTLPINPAGLAAGPDVGNVVLVGRRAALAAGCVRPEELEHVGEQGFVLRAVNGRIALAGGGDAATLCCLARYLEDHGVRFYEPGRREVVPALAGRPLHELVEFDRPYFPQRLLPGGWRLGTSPPPAGAASGQAPADRASAMALAAAIKSAARARRALTPATLRAAAASGLHTYVAARLTWNPFLDATRLIDDYRSAN